MAIQVGGTTVINDSRTLQNVGGLKTVGGTSILGSGDIATGGSTTAGAVGTYVWAFNSVAGQLSFGGTYSGSNLYPASLILSGTSPPTTSSSFYLSAGTSSLSGTWRSLGSQYNSTFWQQTALYVRIS